MKELKLGMTRLLLERIALPLFQILFKSWNLAQILQKLLLIHCLKNKNNRDRICRSRPRRLLRKPKNRLRKLGKRLGSSIEKHLG
jgi:hypothetical protein